MEGPGIQASFWTVGGAAQRLGVSRLGVREAVARGALSARRDNEDRLRIDLPEEGPVLSDGVDLDADKIIAFLFDDIEELEAALAARDTQNRRLADLVARQDKALSQSDRALTEAEAHTARLAETLEKALRHLEEGDRRQGALAALSDRSLSVLESAL